MSDKKTVFAIMRDLSVDYDTIVEIAKSAKINVIKSPNTEVSPRHLKKILQAAAEYKAAQVVSETPEAPAEAISEVSVVNQEENVATVEVSPEELSVEPAAAIEKEDHQDSDTSSEVVADAATAETVGESVDEDPSNKAEVVSGSTTVDQNTETSQPAPKGATDSPKANQAKEGHSNQRNIKREIVVKRTAEFGGGSQMATMTGRSIPLEQLQARTGRGGTPRRSQDRPDRGTSPRTPRQPRTPRPDAAVNPAVPQVPVDASNPNKETRRRIRITPKPEDVGDRQRNVRASKRRQEVQQNDIYGGGRYNQHRMRRKSKGRKGSKLVITTPAAHKRVVRVDETMSVGELGKVMGVKSSDLIRKLMDLGVMATINQQLDFATIELITPDFKFEAKNVAFDEQEFLSGPVIQEEDELPVDSDSVLRAPVVTIMGHVDHGKTTLLDRIRSADVVSGEAGGITQHIGAYRVVTESGPVVFLDTPGHAAFSAMRARGASVTDLVVLVVAADDGVMPQTLESINHAKAAGVTVIVAVNKCDKQGVNLDRIRQELSGYELIPEEWGGNTMFVNISALRGDGVDELLENLALQAEVLDLKANPNKPAYGRVVEARIDKGRGSVVTVLVQEGTLKKGDYMLVGQNYGRVRMMTDHLGKIIKEAGPSTPVELAGLNGVPAAGEEFFLVKNERDAKRIVSNREVKSKEANKPASILSADPWDTNIKKYQNLIIKADVSGSLEAIRASIQALSTDEVEVKVISSGIGFVNESDVTLAQASEATIIGFNVGGDTKARKLAERVEIGISKYSIIYELIDRVKDLMSGLLEPEIVEERLGKVQVRQVFHIQRVGSIAGSFVLDGKVNRNAHARVIRDGEQIHEGQINTLKRFKDDVREVSNGYECGIAIDGYKDIQEGDMLEVIEYKEIRRRIDDEVRL